ncbi:hypothetical protein F4680DRAFT_283199 [Xylaria scruposa]|nr:hypothetical protein F4680DRAFT_283199 [Xylaria scruposa]
MIYASATQNSSRRDSKYSIIAFALAFALAFASVSRVRAPMHSVFVAPGTNSHLSLSHDPVLSRPGSPPTSNKTPQQATAGTAGIRQRWSQQSGPQPCRATSKLAGFGGFAWSTSLHIPPRQPPDLLLPSSDIMDIPRHLGSYTGNAAYYDRMISCPNLSSFLH